MDDYRDAGDCHFCKDEEQATSTAEVAMNQIPVKASGETFDKLSYAGAPMTEEATSAQNCFDEVSVLEPPIFEMNPSCHPKCDTITHDYQDVSHSNVEPAASHGLSEKDGESDEASDLFKLVNKKKPPVCQLGDSRENLKMECESSAAISPDKEVGCLSWQQCHHHLLFHGDEELALPGNRSWDGNEETDHNGQDYQDLMADTVDCSSHPYLGGLTLDELDDDSIFHIANFMEARSVRNGLGPACKRFQAMFDNEAYWKTRINMKWQKRYPAVTAPADFCWEEACMAGEDCQRVWGDPESHSHHFMYTCNVYGEVDTVHLMQNGKLLLSGDRNRNLNVINLSRYTPTEDTAPTPEEMNDMLVLSNSTIHKGWIWSLTSVDNHVMTGSWDTHIRVFDLNSDLDNFSVHKCKSAVLSLYSEDNDIVASCFDKKIYFFDRRSDKYTSHTFHKQAVMSVTGNQDYVISGSEDKTVAIYDRRAGKIFETIKLDAYALCLSFEDNQLWFGDKSGLIHLYDANRMFSHVGTYDVGHKDKVTDIIYTRGSMFTCSGDKTLKVLTPTRDPEQIASFDGHNKELAKVAYSCGVLASAGGDESIGVWLPKYWYHNTYHL